MNFILSSVTLHFCHCKLNLHTLLPGATGHIYLRYTINSLPNDKILDWSKLQALADDNINLAEKLKFVLERVENIAGKGENAGYQHFLLFPQCFQKASLSGSLKVGIVW